MTREFTCIVCPNGCRITAEFEPATEKGSAPSIGSITGNLCPRGVDYVCQELIDPRRTIATSILVEGGELPLASVRLTSPIPKDRIMDAVALIRRYKVAAPVQAGTVIIHDLFGLGSDVIVTKSINVAK